VPLVAHDILFRNTEFETEYKKKKDQENPKDVFPTFDRQLKGLPISTKNPRGARRSPAKLNGGECNPHVDYAAHRWMTLLFFFTFLDTHLGASLFQIILFFLIEQSLSIDLKKHQQQSFMVIIIKIIIAFLIIICKKNNAT
jgi:hypothetical protein